MQVSADWRTYGTAKELAEYIGNDFIVEGTGLYLSDTDAILVIVDDVEDNRPWKKDWPEDTIFEVHVFNCPIEQTILRYAQAQIPARKDERTKRA